MSDERDPDVRPTWSETGLPLCDDACPNFDGKRCKAMGFRPDRFCEPMLLQQTEEAGEATDERDRLAAALRVAREALEDPCGAVAEAVMWSTSNYEAHRRDNMRETLKRIKAALFPGDGGPT